MDKHLEVADANRKLYDSMDNVEDLRNLFDIDIQKKYVTSMIKECFELLGKKGSDIKVLDVGTGFGHLIKYFEPYTPLENVLGIDISPKSIEVAKGRYPKAKFLACDFINDFKTDEKYDLITAYSVMHHFYDWKVFIDKIDKCLAPGGVIYIDHEPLDSALSWLYKTLSSIKNRDNMTLVTAECHQYNKMINPNSVALALPNYTISIHYQNISIFGELIRKYNIDLSKIFMKRVPDRGRFEWLFKQFFYAYTLIAAKAQEINGK